MAAILSPKSETCPLRKENFPRTNNFQTESSSTNGCLIYERYRLMINEIIDSLITRSHNLYCEVDVMSANRKRFHLYASKTGMSSDQKERYLSKLRASSSNHMMAETSSSVNRLGRNVIRKGKVSVNAGEVKLLSERLRILEEEAEMVKRTFLGNVEERKKLMNEIYQQFQVMQSCVCLRDGVPLEKSCGVLIINPPIPEKGRSSGTGLSQVLCPELNPSLSLEI